MANISQEYIFGASDPTVGDLLGQSVAIHGNTAVIGAGVGGSIDSGAVYVFVWSGNNWTQQQKLVATDASQNDFFGKSVAIEGDRIVVGAPGDNVGSATAAGSAYVFTRVGTTWTQQQKLTAASPATGETFGTSVSISGNRIAIGAPGATVGAGYIYAGVVYTFTYSSQTWSQEARLYATGLEAYMLLGSSVSLVSNTSGTTLVTGAIGAYDTLGAAYVFNWNGTAWVQQGILSDPDNDYAQYFGTSVALDPTGNLALVGSPYKFQRQGQVLVFRRLASNWRLDTRLTASDAASGHNFGTAVVLDADGDTAIVAAPKANQGKGFAYVFRNFAGKWNEQFTLAASDGTTSDDFAGTSVAIHENLAVVGAQNRINGSLGLAGAAYGFVVRPSAPLNTGRPYQPLTWSGGVFHDDEINLLNGEKVEEVADISVNTRAGSLSFTRAYRQSKQTAFDFMGLGWTNNHAVTLTMTPATFNTIMVRMPNGGELYFTEQASHNGHYLSAAGSNVVIDGNSTNGYILVALDKSTFEFDGSGRLIKRDWTQLAMGSWTYSYDGNGRLSTVADGDGRSLQFAYYTTGDFKNGKLWRVGDQSTTNLASTPGGRYVEFDYTQQKLNGSPITNAKALLTTVRDVLGNVWTYSYYGQQVGEADNQKRDLLIKLESPPIKTVHPTSGATAAVNLEELAYTFNGSTLTNLTRTLGAGLSQTQLQFQPNAEPLTRETTASLETTHFYDDGVYSGFRDPLGNVWSQALDKNYRPIVTMDANGNRTSFGWSSNGKLLMQTSDEQDNGWSYSYLPGGYHADLPQEDVDPLGRKTKFEPDPESYRVANRKRYDRDEKVLSWKRYAFDTEGRIIYDANYDAAGTDLLPWMARNYHASGNGKGLLSTYGKSYVGNNGFSTQGDEWTTYAYDSAGRVVKATQSSLYGPCTATYTLYDNAGNVVASICNYSPGQSADPSTPQQAVALHNPAEPDKNRVTVHIYDTMGRRVMTTVHAGSSFARTTLTVYNALSQVVRTIENYVESGLIADPYVRAREDFDHGVNNDQNLVTDFTFNELGLVRRRIDPDRMVTLFGYDEAGRQTRVIRSASRPDYNNTFGLNGDYGLRAYPANDRPDEDIVTSTGYDAAGNVIKSTNAIGDVTLTGYDTNNRPIKIIVNASQPNYDMQTDPSLHRYFAVEDADRDLISLKEYDVVGRTIRTLDTMESWTLYGYDGLDRLVKMVRSASQPSYDISKDPALVNYLASNLSDLDIVTETAYDTYGREMYVQDALGRRDWTGYHFFWQDIPVRKIDNAIGTATNGSSADPRSENYAADIFSADRDLVSEQTPDQMTYHRVWRSSDALGNWTLFGFDANNRVVRTITNASNLEYSPVTDGDPTLERYTPAANADVDQDLITQTIYDGEGRVARTIDPQGRETRFTYDALGRKIKTITNFGSGVFDPAQPDRDLITVTTFDLAGRILTTTDVRGTTTTLTYDRAGRPLMVTTATNTSLATKGYSCYDKAGRVLRTITNYCANAEQPLPDLRDELGNWLFAPSVHGTHNDENLIASQVFDRAGRVIQTINPMGVTNQIAYDKDGQVESTTDAMNMVTKHRYDRARRRVLTVMNWKPNGEDPKLWMWNGSNWTKSDGTTAIPFGSQNDENLIVQVTYDEAGRQITQREPRGGLTSYIYDALDRRTRTTDAMNTRWDTEYERVGNGTLRSTALFPGLASTLSYPVINEFDRLSRPKAIKYGDLATTPDVYFTYDRPSTSAVMSEFALKNSVVAKVRETTYSFDQAQRMVSATFDKEGDGTNVETVAYQYDPAGLRTRMTLPGNLAVTYSYNAKGELVSLTDWDTQTSTFTSDGAGRLRAISRHNGLTSHYKYDASSQLRQIRHATATNIYGQFDYEVDGRGQCTSALETLRIPSSDNYVTILGSDPSVEYTGTWAADNSSRYTTDTSAKLRFRFLGTSNNFVFGIGPNYGKFDVYVNGSLAITFDAYDASGGIRQMTVPVSGLELHNIEIRVRTDKNAASSGYRMMFVRLVALTLPYVVQQWTYAYDGANRLKQALLYPGDHVMATTKRNHIYGYDSSSNRISSSLTLNGGAATVTTMSYNVVNQINSPGFIYDANGNMVYAGAETYTWDRANRLLETSGTSYDRYVYDGAGRAVFANLLGSSVDYTLDVASPLPTVVQTKATVQPPFAPPVTHVQQHLHGPRGIHATRSDLNDMNIYFPPQSDHHWTWLITDGLGSVRGHLNNVLKVNGATHYTPYLERFDAIGDTIAFTGLRKPFGPTGEIDYENGLLYLRARYAKPEIGTFISRDPLETMNSYMYVGGNPINRTDPSGLIALIDGGGAGKASKYRKIFTPPKKLKLTRTPGTQTKTGLKIGISQIENVADSDFEVSLPIRGQKTNERFGRKSVMAFGPGEQCQNVVTITRQYIDDHLGGIPGDGENRGVSEFVVLSDYIAAAANDDLQVYLCAMNTLLLDYPSSGSSTVVAADVNNGGINNLPDYLGFLSGFVMALYNGFDSGINQNRDIHPYWIGSVRLHPDYNDNQANQINFHIWAYIATTANPNYLPVATFNLGSLGNLYHERIEKNLGGQSLQDLAAGEVGLLLGLELREGVISPRHFGERFQSVFGDANHDYLWFASQYNISLIPGNQFNALTWQTRNRLCQSMGLGLGECMG